MEVATTLVSRVVQQIMWANITGAQRGFIAGRDISSNSWELDACMRHLTIAAPAGSSHSQLASLPWFDIPAAFMQRLLEAAVEATPALKNIQASVDLLCSGAQRSKRRITVWCRCSRNSAVCRRGARRADASSPLRSTPRFARTFRIDELLHTRADDIAAVWPGSSQCWGQAGLPCTLRRRCSCPRSRPRTSARHRLPPAPALQRSRLASRAYRMGWQAAGDAWRGLFVVKW